MNVRGGKKKRDPWYNYYAAGIFTLDSALVKDGKRNVIGLYHGKASTKMIPCENWLTHLYPAGLHHFLPLPSFLFFLKESLRVAILRIYLVRLPITFSFNCSVKSTWFVPRHRKKVGSIHLSVESGMK